MLKNKIAALFLLFLLLGLASCNSTTSSEVKETALTSKDSLSKNTEDRSIDSLNESAINEWRIGNYQKALDYITKAYKKAKATNDEEELAKVLNTLGLVHWRLENNADAMECYTESGKIAEKRNMHRLLGLTHTNRGLILKEQHNFEKAFFHNNKAIEIFKTHGYYRDLAIALNNQGQIFKNKGMIDSARVYYLRALENYKKVNYKDGAAASYYNLSDIYLRQGAEKQSLDAVQKSLKLSLEIQSKVHITEAYQKMSEVYEHFHQPDSALKYFKIYNDLNKAILVANQSNILARYQADMGSEVKNLQIRNLEKEQELAENRIWFIGTGIIIVLLIVAFFVYRYLSKIRYNKRKLEMELSNSKKILDVKEQELKAYIIDLTKKSVAISKLQEEVSKGLQPHNKNDSEVAQLLEQKILTEEDWETFKIKFKSIYPAFFSRIKQFKITLTEAEIRLIVLLYLDLSGKEMAKILGISPQSVRVGKMRLKKKLKNEGYDSVEDFLPMVIK